MVSHHLQPEAFSLCPVPGATGSPTHRESVSAASTVRRAERSEAGTESMGDVADAARDETGADESISEAAQSEAAQSEAAQSEAAQSESAQSEAAQSEPIDFEWMYRRYSPYVAKIGYRLLGRDSEVDDLVQDVFLAAHRGLRSIRDPRAVKGWLATVTVRLARRRLRSRRVRAALHLDSSPDYSDIVDVSVTPEQRAQVAHVYQLLDRLPVNQRIAWSLRYVEGETLERVAELCKCSLATAKRRIKAVQDMITVEVSRA